MLWNFQIQYSYLLIIWVSECLLFNANSAIIQLYHGKNKLFFNEMMMSSAGRHVTPLGNIILISSQPVFAISP